MRQERKRGGNMKVFVVDADHSRDLLRKPLLLLHSRSEGVSSHHSGSTKTNWTHLTHCDTLLSEHPWWRFCVETLLTCRDPASVPSLLWWVGEGNTLWVNDGLCTHSPFLLVLLAGNFLMKFFFKCVGMLRGQLLTSHRKITLLESFYFTSTTS